MQTVALMTNDDQCDLLNFVNDFCYGLATTSANFIRSSNLALPKTIFMYYHIKSTFKYLWIIHRSSHYWCAYLLFRQHARTIIGHSEWNKKHLISSVNATIVRIISFIRNNMLPFWCQQQLRTFFAFRINPTVFSDSSVNIFLSWQAMKITMDVT